jgi:NAD(P)-dependent dehydrogenase (short-subunit alcohol dehydrogenase family)
VSELRFDGEVAIVTGAGGRPSLGRAFAHLLAARGARVVVNDLGVGPDGHGRRRAHADLVAAEIAEAGGEAVADDHSVADERGARAIVQTALDRWGRIDILINNAGVVVLADFSEVASEDIRNIIDVHLLGSIWMARAVWPHMRERGHGRIVNIVSASLLGMRYVVPYGAAKGGILSLSRGLAVEGAPYGIRVNAVGPAAATAALALLSKPGAMDLAPRAELVAPAVALLAHRECPVSGRYLESAGGRTVARAFVESRGYHDPELTPESLRDHLDDVFDFTGATAIPDPLEGEYAHLVDPLPYAPPPARGEGQG